MQLRGWGGQPGQRGRLVNENGELRYAWAVSDRERRVMRQIGREDSIREDWRGFMGAGDAEE